MPDLDLYILWGLFSLTATESFVLLVSDSKFNNVVSVTPACTDLNGTTHHCWCQWPLTHVLLVVLFFHTVCQDQDIFPRCRFKLCPEESIRGVPKPAGERGL